MSATQIIKAYNNLIQDPNNIVGNMNYDEYVEWLEMGSIEDLQATLEYFESFGMEKDWIDILKIEIDKRNKRNK